MPMSSLTNPNATFQKSSKNREVINEQLNEVNSQVKSVEAGNMSESQRAY